MCCRKWSYIAYTRDIDMALDSSRAMSSAAFSNDDSNLPPDEEEEPDQNSVAPNDRAQLWKSLCDADTLERQAHSHSVVSAEDPPGTTLLPNQQRLLKYNAYLQNQLYYDDLKHVDYRFIDYGGIFGEYSSQSVKETSNHHSPLIIEQDKSLGKGGFCWDAAFVLAEWISEGGSELPILRRGEPTTLLELGCGTGMCGIFIAQTLPSSIACKCSILLTDMSGPIQDLIRRNVRRNMDHVYEEELHDYLVKEYPSWKRAPTVAKSNGSTLETAVLDWDDVASSDGTSCGTYDIVFGSDVVATLYNPIHLANAIHKLCHTDSMVYISFKKRLNSIHDAFYDRMGTLFRQVNIISTKNKSRNQNPDVYILYAYHKR